MHFEAIRHLKHIDLFPIEFTAPHSNHHYWWLSDAVCAWFLLYYLLWKWLNFFLLFVDHVTVFVILFSFYRINQNKFARKSTKQTKSEKNGAELQWQVCLILMRNFKLAATNALTEPLIMSSCQNANVCNKELFTFFWRNRSFRGFFCISL